MFLYLAACIVQRGWYPNSYGPTELHMKSFKVATELFKRLQPKIDTYLEKVNAIGEKMEVAVPLFY